jgi:ribonuclease G
MKADRAKHTILPMTRFGLIQITRQRVRPEMNITTSEQCPSCQGSGRISASILLEDEIETNLENIFKQLNPARLELVAHPYVAAFFNKGLWSRRRQWVMKYRKKIRVVGDPSFHYTEYRFFDQNEEEIHLQ